MTGQHHSITHYPCLDTWTCVQYRLGLVRERLRRDPCNESPGISDANTAIAEDDSPMHKRAYNA
jgi:hypothetical protein